MPKKIYTDTLIKEEIIQMLSNLFACSNHKCSQTLVENEDGTWTATATDFTLENEVSFKGNSIQAIFKILEAL